MTSHEGNGAPMQPLNITSYNIRGLEGKQNNEEFITYLQNFDIFILLETHTLPNAVSAEEFKQQQPDFEFLHWRDATRVLRRGRGIGGCIIGVRKSLNERGISHSVVERNDVKILQISLCERKLNIIPLYIHTIGWKGEFKPVEEAFENQEVPMTNAIVMGDVNIRIGEFKQAVEPSYCVANTNGRLSHDKKMERAGKFLAFCTNNKLQILNGLTHGDLTGSYTYFSNLGNSTIDIAAVSQNLMAAVVDFKVDKPETGRTRHGSDHLPICLQLDLEVLRNAQVTRLSPMRLRSSYTAPFDSSIVVNEPTLDSEIRAEEVIYVLRRGSFPEFSKSVLDEITRHCNDIFNATQRDSIVGSNIATSSDVTKILLQIVMYRLIRWCKQKHILSDSQTRYSVKFSKIDAVYSLSTIAKIKLADKCTRVYSYLVHFESITSEMPALLWAKLQKLGVSSKVLRFLREKLGENTFRNYFQNGGAMAKLLFTLYLNDLPEELKGGFVIDGRHLNVIMYADKIAVLSERTNDLQNMINQLEAYCNKWSMVVDMERSKVMVLRRGGRIALNENWIITGKKIETTGKAEFLDFQFTSTLSNKTQVLNMIADAKSKLMSFGSTSENWTRLMNLYMVQMWGCEQFKEIKALQTSFIRKTRNTCTNLNNLALKLNLKYIKSLYFAHNDSSISRFLTLKVIDENILWTKKLDNICSAYNLRWKSFLNSEPEWSNFCENLLSRLEEP